MQKIYRLLILLSVYGAAIPTASFADTPEQAVTKAIDTYPSIQSGMEKVKANQMLLYATWANLLPTFSPSYAITHTGVSPQVKMIGVPSAVTSSLINIGFSVPIFDSGVTFFQAQALRSNIHAQEQGVNIVKNSVAVQAIQAYVMVALARKQITLYDELRTRIAKLNKSPSNNPTSHDLLESDYKDITDSLNTFKESAEEAEHSYEAIVGEAPEAQLQDLDSIAISIDIPDTANQALVIAQQLSPALLGAHDQVQAAKATKDAEIAKDFLPYAGYSYSDISGDRRVSGNDVSPKVKTGVMTAGLSVSVAAPFKVLADRHFEKSVKFDEQTAMIQLRLAMRNDYSQDTAFNTRLAELTVGYDQIQAAYAAVSHQIDTGAATDVLAARNIVLNMRKATDAIVGVTSQRVISRAQIRGLIGNLSEYPSEH